MYSCINQAYVFQEENEGCVAFLMNNDTHSANVEFQNRSYQLPAKSISILPDCVNITFNTAQVITVVELNTFDHRKVEL